MKNRITKDMVYKCVEKDQGLVASDPHRLHYHIMPPVGLLNDPNGFVFFKGVYHIFYQWNPFAVEHGMKCWGHYISEDLIHWREAPVALLPDKWYDKNGCYSGSAVVYQEQLYVFYTGNVKDDEDNRQSYQCLAISEDGIHFEKKGPIIYVPDGYTAHFRDPKVFYRGDSWWMVLGAQTEAKKGETVVYQSKDLTTWTFKGNLIGSGYKGLENFGYMWECPDMFRLRDKDILLVCPQGIPAQGISYQNIFQSGYFAGEFDNQSMSFHHEKFIELDRGFDFYAPQTMQDPKGRRLLFGWMGNAEEGPTKHPTAKYKWVHALTVPRQLEWKNGKLLQYPVEEFKQLLENEVDFGEIHLDDELPFPLPNINETAFAMYLSVESIGANYLEMQIGESHLIYNQAINLFTFKRRSFTKPHSVESRHCTVDFLHDILILKDTSSMEIFLNQGEEVFTSRIFEEQETNKIRLQANGKIKVNVKKWNVRRVTEY
ncbi:sucrose-6-phosphate hydrolase [Virgibacillus pantothenticus]|uniref:Sucrose-6-phosphate hydrolase n=1 Tax=Virgibacillus pantothenticus TaxID=1473 RepID=A0A0L0QLQ3_VIRPA|nr:MULTISPECIES: sucrose-6-phosphate hydrolase [Virgibacillus]API93225.1 sucrose-6-phosphate hydrolase [Virgibacillus sp. 6R]KNE19507.1 sucrose-6-phosphate hydrolase [Virgibacillus pantothenticus]MBS7428729.1 sucrose-6-phosphate hydrolase [Virgibacillus sp. 19R1-5]MBU8565741.1 sucrose-6-phosphate hydrolase [Virgibacillus pantothenticus]MBU8599672.1 sucrose-6-phosphate hydrolase [Virgibacillus pantothenticus]